MVPKPPAKVLDIIRFAWSREASVHELGKRIEGCPDLADMVLRFVNSQHMELGREVAHPSRAVLLLGAKSAGTLAIAHGLSEVIRGLVMDPDVKQQLTEDCVRRAAIACGLARRFPNVQADQAFVVGLLAESGKFLSLMRDPANAIWMDSVRCTAGQGRMSREREYFGAVHTEELELMCRTWGLPKELLDPLITHHEPEDPAALRPHRVRQVCRWADLLGEVITSTDPPSTWAEVKAVVARESRLGPDALTEILTVALGGAQETAQVLGLTLGDQPAVAALLSGQEEDPSGMGRDALLRMVQQLKRERDTMKGSLDEIKLRLQALMASDTLTGMAGRPRYFTVLRSEVERAERSGLAATVVHVDVDNLEQHNIRYGHDAGDAILKKVGAMLERMTRESDFAARIGGDEFALVMPRTTPSGGRIIAERIRAAIETLRLTHDGQQIRVSATVVGLCMDEMPGSTAEELHNKAAAELDRVKGANRVAWAA